MIKLVGRLVSIVIVPCGMKWEGSRLVSSKSGENPSLFVNSYILLVSVDNGIYEVRLDTKRFCELLNVPRFKKILQLKMFLTKPDTVTLNLKHREDGYEYATLSDSDVKTWVQRICEYVKK